jgi:hypothetical protein
MPVRLRSEQVYSERARFIVELLVVNGIGKRDFVTDL